MPLEVIRIMQSTTYALSTGDEFKAAFTLWCASWMEVPAASLPNDERMLEFLSRAKSWKKVKAIALRGWVLCSDGRLYHPIIAKNAIDAWDRRVDFRDAEDNKNERQKRWRERCKSLANQLRELGITPPRGASLETLEEMLRDANVDTQASTSPSTQASTVDDVEIGIDSKETVKRQLTDKDHLSGTTSDTVEKPEVAEQTGDERPGNKRNVEIAVLLRNSGIKPFTFAHPLAVEWGSNPKVTDELLTAAVQSARDYKPEGDISPNYLKPIVEQLLTPPEAKAAKPQQDTWWTSNTGIERKGREIGLHPRPTEGYPEYKDRIFEELRKRGGKAA